MRHSFYVLITGFLAGVAWRSLFDVGVSGVMLLVALAGAAFVVAWARRPNVSFTLYAALALLACVLGAVRTEFAYDTYERARVFADGAPLAASGVVAAEPDARENHTVLVIDVEADTAAGMAVRVRANVPPYPTFGYGDRVSVAGTLQVPRAFESATGRTFAYPEFLMKDGIHYVLEDARVARVAGTGGSRMTATLLSIKHAWLDAVSRVLPEPSASLAGGLIVGAKRSLGEHWLALFREAGIIHLVVLSGYNLTVVAKGIVSLTGFLPRVIGVVLGVCGVVAFALLTGGGATVARASIMAIIAMIAAYTLRPYAVLRALAFAACAMVLWNPFVLLYDPGFQLSFVATVGLVLVSPVVAERLWWLPERFGLREIVSATLSTQLAVLPLLLYQVGQVSLIAPVVNVLVLPPIPYVMGIGFTAGLVGMLASTLALPLAWAAHLILSYVFLVTDVAGRLPFASVMLPPIAWWVVALLYGALAYGYVRVTRTARLASSGRR